MHTRNPDLYDHDAENALAGAALIDSEIFKLADVDSTDFHQPDIRLLWQAGTRLAAQGRAVDHITLDNDVLQRIGGPARIIQLTVSCPSHTRYADYADIVRSYAEQRRLLQVATEIGKAAYVSDREQRALMIDQARARLTLTTKPPREHELHPITACELLTTNWPEPRWAVPGLLPTGLAILAGAAKLGKSWLALQISLAISTGGIALGRRVEHGAVLYLALEDPTWRLKERMQKQHWPTTANADFVTIGSFAQVGDLRNGGAEILARRIEAKSYRLVVIDTLSRAIVGDQNDANAMTRALEPLQEIAHKCNCAVLLIDHHNKSPGIDAVCDILGSTAKGALADCIWSLYRERGKAHARLSITGREVSEQTLQLAINWATGCWNVEAGADTELELTARRREILDALSDMGTATLLQVAQAVGQPKSNTHARLQDMVGAGLVRRITDDNEIRYGLL